MMPSFNSDNANRNESDANGEKENTQSQDQKEIERLRIIKLAQAFQLVVGKCGCTGKITYSFQGFRNTRPRDEYVRGRKNPTEEISSCYCDVCGQPYDCIRPDFAKIIQDYRGKL